MICSNALTSPNDSLLQATSRRLEYLGLHTLRATSTGDTEAAICLICPVHQLYVSQLALEERWLNTWFSPDREAHVREHTHLIELTSRALHELHDG
jgi:hypothetical protein